MDLNTVSVTNTENRNYTSLDSAGKNDINSAYSQRALQRNEIQADREDYDRTDWDDYANRFFNVSDRSSGNLRSDRTTGTGSMTDRTMTDTNTAYSDWSNNRSELNPNLTDRSNVYSDNWTARSDMTGSDIIGAGTDTDIYGTANTTMDNEQIFKRLSDVDRRTTQMYGGNYNNTTSDYLPGRQSSYLNSQTSSARSDRSDRSNRSSRSNRSNSQTGGRYNGDRSDMDTDFSSKSRNYGTNSNYNSQTNRSDRSDRSNRSNNRTDRSNRSDRSGRSNRRNRDMTTDYTDRTESDLFTTSG